MATKESSLGVSPVSDGTLIRNRESVVVDPVTGEESVVESQVATLARPDGDIADPDTAQIVMLLKRQLEELQVIRMLLQQMAE